MDGSQPISRLSVQSSLFGLLCNCCSTGFGLCLAKQIYGVSIVQKFIERNRFAVGVSQFFKGVIVDGRVWTDRWFERRPAANLARNFCQGNGCYESVMVGEGCVWQWQVNEFYLLAESSPCFVCKGAGAFIRDNDKLSRASSQIRSLQRSSYGLSSNHGDAWIRIGSF